MSKNERGFTLMELMVAMVITVLLVGALFNVFNLAGRAWQKGEARTQRYQDLRRIMDRMSEEIRSAILLNPDYNAGPDRIPGNADDPDFRFYGEGEELNFISVSHPPDGWDYGSTPTELRFDCCEISYYLSPSGTFNRRLQTSNLPDDSITAGGTHSPFGERIIRLNFTYYEADGTSHDDWDSGPSGDTYCKGKLPVKVRIGLTARADLAREQKEETFTTDVWLAQANF
ncbi:prepilin-type N-terminal cleavage/methylation domain-containing protein [bacterium]|nr:prepilin-type N-terminal cleavage/methylation domain-containing protein [bacterium]